MRVERFGDGARFVLFKTLHLFEEGHKSFRVVAGAVHIFETEIVGLAFEVARELQEGQWDTDLRSLVESIASVAADHDERNGAELGIVHAGLFAHGVVRSDVADLVRHYAGQFCFFVSGEDGPAIHVEETAGEGHGVDRIVVDDLDGERNLGV